MIANMKYLITMTEAVQKEATAEGMMDVDDYDEAYGNFD